MSAAESKVLGVFFTLVLITVFTGAVLGKLPWLSFWGTAAVIGLYAYVIAPYLRNEK